MRIHEIRIFQGVLAQDPVFSASTYMTTPRFPPPRTVCCSSFVDQDTHCFKAYDGDATSHSMWRTRAVGTHNLVLSQPQWILLDLGPDHSALPTSITIVCDPDAERASCPRTFKFEGSPDNIQYTTLLAVDLAKYHNEYRTPGGAVFPFSWSTHVGRPSGLPCGSCLLAPEYTCARMAYDGSCESTYCDGEGLCGELPACLPGQYLESNYQAEGRPSILCRPCLPGSYGNRSGLVTSSCSGPCQAGYYCLAGSTSATQYPCGSDAVYCPPGSPVPVPAALGMKTIGGNETTRTDVVTCPTGHYCVQGVQFPCPLGTYGDTTGLATLECAGRCIAGEYCPPGSVSPLVCPKGFYCPDGREKAACPAGTYGGRTGDCPVTLQ